MSKNWTPDEIAQLEALWDTSLPPRDIADRLGVTPGVLRHTARKLGLSRRTRSRPPPPQSLRPDITGGHSARDVAPDPGCVTQLLDLGPAECRWPGAGRPALFCGAKVEGLGPYCPRHVVRAYRR